MSEGGPGSAPAADGARCPGFSGRQLPPPRHPAAVRERKVGFPLPGNISSNFGAQEQSPAPHPTLFKVLRVLYDWEKEKTV